MQGAHNIHFLSEREISHIFRKQNIAHMEQIKWMSDKWNKSDLEYVDIQTMNQVPKMPRF